MDSKSHSPKEKTACSGHNSLSPFWQSLIATTISIVLTFGTAAVIDYYKKESAKKEMVMMIIYDFDKTIKSVEKNDTAFYDAMYNQADLAVHPEHFDSLRSAFIPATMVINTAFPETTEKIFSSNVETFNTISNVDFISMVSEFYYARQTYKKQVIDEYKNNIVEINIYGSIDRLFSVNFPEYYLLNHTFLKDMRKYRDKCVNLMDISEEDLAEFSSQKLEEGKSADSVDFDSDFIQEVDSLMRLIMKASEKYENENNESEE